MMRTTNLIGFDLDKTISNKHIYNLVASNLYQEIAKLERDIEGLQARSKEWGKKLANPGKYVDKNLEATKDDLKRQQEIIKKAEQEIASENSASRKSVSATFRMNRSMSGSSGSGSIALPPKERIALATEAVEALKIEIADIEGNRDEKIEEVRSLAEQKIAKYDGKISEAAAKKQQYVDDRRKFQAATEAQWEFLKENEVDAMCDKTLFQALIKMLQDDGHKVALVSYNSYVPLVKKFLTETVGLDISDIAIEAWLPSEAQQKTIFKNSHLENVINGLGEPLASELKANPDRVMLIDDDGGNVKNAKKVGHKDSFHFDIEAMKKIDKKSAPNAYLAFLIVKFGYEQKLSEHIERLNLGPMIEHFKAQQALTQGAEQKVGAGLDRAGALPIIGARTRKPESPGSSLSGSPEGQEVSSPPVTRGRGV